MTAAIEAAVGSGGAVKPVVLMYHRIAEPQADPWGLAVRPRHFAEQLSVLRRTRTPLTLADFVGRVAAGTLPADAVAVTFDDGYADNLTAALPRLAAADVPATICLATGYLGQDFGFWWDEMAELVLLGLPGPELDGTPFGLEMITVGAPDPPERVQRWRTAAGAVTPRQQALLALWAQFHGMDMAGRSAALMALRSATGQAFSSTAGRPLTAAEAGALAETGLVTIGAHSVTHPRLSQLPPEACEAEMTDSRRACEAIAGRPVDVFAYPFGDDSASVRETAARLGFSCALGVTPAPVTPEADRFALPRIQVPDLDGDRFAALLGSVAG